MASMRTENGKLCGFVTEGTLTDDAIEEAFFGSGIVLERKNIEQMLAYMGTNGFRHHVCVTKGNVAEIAKEALEKYLGYNVDRI